MTFFDDWTPRSLKRDRTHTNGSPTTPGWFNAREGARFTTGLLTLGPNHGLRSVLLCGPDANRVNLAYLSDSKAATDAFGVD